MGRPRKSAALEPENDPRVAVSRETQSRDGDERAADERELLTDDMESALYVPRHEWAPGKTYRWVRMETNGAADNKNWAQMTRVGWTPVPRSRHADRFPFLAMPGQGDNSEGAIIFGGLCLCERDTRLVNRDRERQQARTAAANSTVEPFLIGGGDPSAPFQPPRQGVLSSVNTSRGIPQFKE